MVNNSTNINKKLSLGEVIVHFVDIGGIDDHHCLNFL
jgi:hypothetical protein